MMLLSIFQVTRRLPYGAAFLSTMKRKAGGAAPAAGSEGAKVSVSLCLVARAFLC